MVMKLFSIEKASFVVTLGYIELQKCKYYMQINENNLEIKNSYI